MKRLIVYDLDGTLVDTGEDITEAVNHMLTVLSASPLSRQEVRRFVGQGLHDLIRRCLQTEDQRLVEQGTGLFERYYAEHLLDHSALYPGVRETLEYFKDRRQAVLTNKPDPFARDLLAALGVSGHFREIAAAGAGLPRKPDPTALLAMMRRAGVGAEEALLVGDSVIDVDTGRRAGVLTVILTQGFEDPEDLAAAAPDAVARNFQEFLALAKQRGW
ncbi:MAG: HAD-IA family hydrolase [Candidatus Omnitrophica bacterium]|nr:HAD-IA family hydrolase [Candidatus Omnitrophota bacterium]